jgi:hypothetical protein
MATRLPEAERTASSKGPNGKESETPMSLKSVKHQKPARAGLPMERKGEAESCPAER